MASNSMAKHGLGAMQPMQRRRGDGNEGTIWSAAFAILLASNFFQSMAAFMANTTLPLYIDSMGVSAGVVGLIVGAFAITALLVRPVAGPAFDSFSRKKLLMCSQAVIAVAFVLYGFTTSVPTLFVVRLLHGLGIGCSGPLAMSLVSEYLPPPKFASGISIYALAQTFAQVMGPAVGLWMVGVAGYRATYLTCSLLLSASVASIAMVQEIPRERPPYQLKLGRMFAREAVDKAIVLALFATAFGGTTSYLVLYGTKLGIANLGAYFMVYALCLLATRPLFGRLADRFGAQRILIPGVLCFAASYAMLANVHNFAGFMVVAVVASAGFGACVPLVQSLAMGSVPVGRRGAASNTTFTGMDVGSLLGPILAGAAIEVLEPATGSLLSAYSHMWYAMMVPQAVALAIIVTWNMRQLDHGSSPGDRTA